MPLIRIHTEPTARQLTVFAVTWAAVFGLAGALGLRGGWPAGAAGAAWAAALLGPAARLLRPGLLRRLYVASAWAAWPVGTVVSVAVLAAVYYLVVTPIGLVMRLCGRDPMARRFPASERSCWVRRRAVGDVRRYFRQF